MLADGTVMWRRRRTPLLVQMVMMVVMATVKMMIMVMMVMVLAKVMR